ncbi:MAG TPA: hypothetical protein VKY27_02780 [Bacteriovoracaceae bacterium]|nr:hypothetical protein [Bacteriovoracaceae bacterium]
MKFILFFMMSLGVSAQSLDFLPRGDKLTRGFDFTRDIISDKYLAGPYLIYDCEDQHWVCVVEENYQQCKDQRAKDIRQDKVHARCAPIAEFDVKFSCFQEQLRLVGNVDPTKLCVLENWKRKEITLD